jgi:hypothetical protein
VISGRFRSGHTVNGQPASLTEWRVTAGDPATAATIYDLLGGDAPRPWETKNEDNLEVFTASKGVDIIVEGVQSLKQKMVLWSRSGELLQSGDGEFLEDEEWGIGPTPRIEIYFRLASSSELGVFVFRTSSWSLAQDLVYYGVESELESIGGPALALLELEEVSFVAKNGPRKGQTVNYTKPNFRIRGAAVPM